MVEVKYQSVTQFAAIHGISRVRICKLIGEGRIPAVRVGLQWVIKEGTKMPSDRRFKTADHADIRRQKIMWDKIKNAFVLCASVSYEAGAP